jgi:hypothetical protein
MKKSIIIVIILFLIASIIWFLNQNISEGYVFSVDSKGLSILIIPLEDSEIKEKTEEEIVSLLDAKVSQYQGSVYDIPFINKVLKTDFKKGEKVKVLWNGPVLISAPSQIKGTVLIVK